MVQLNIKFSATVILAVAMTISATLSYKSIPQGSIPELMPGVVGRNIEGSIISAIESILATATFQPAAPTPTFDLGDISLGGLPESLPGVGVVGRNLFGSIISAIESHLATATLQPPAPTPTFDLGNIPIGHLPELGLAGHCWRMAKLVWPLAFLFLIEHE
ncbi:hypothetical protein B0H13DRAFT_2323897 [Mycena leptocephala]|nr:hypothetical protein B0H13DRAFT_2323897 [Mycena leptocephala]